MYYYRSIYVCVENISIFPLSYSPWLLICDIISHLIDIFHSSITLVEVQYTICHSLLMSISILIRKILKKYQCILNYWLKMYGHVLVSYNNNSNIHIISFTKKSFYSFHICVIGVESIYFSFWTGVLITCNRGATYYAFLYSYDDYFSASLSSLV